MYLKANLGGREGGREGQCTDMSICGNLDRSGVVGMGQGVANVLMSTVPFFFISTYIYLCVCVFSRAMGLKRRCGYRLHRHLNHAVFPQETVIATRWHHNAKPRHM